MNNLQINPVYGLYEMDSKAFTSSRQVAETFGKRHADVLRDIANITATNSGVSKDFNECNFALVKYKDSKGERRPEYLMAKDGFVLLVMGYTGKKAMAFKESYIKRFNQMDSFIQSLYATKMEFPDFTNAVLMAHDEPKHYHFSNEINMIYRIIFGMDAKQIRLERSIESGASVRPYLSAYEIKAVETLQRADIGLIIAIPEFVARKEALTRYFASIQKTKLLAA